MDTSLPAWVADIGTLSSIIGVVITAVLLYHARKIRDSFLRRARLPAITVELKRTTSSLSENLKTWSNDRQPALAQFAQVRGLLENLRYKLPSAEKQRVNAFLRALQPRRRLGRERLSSITEDRAWDLYADLSGIVVQLEQLAKDSKWN